MKDTYTFPCIIKFDEEDKIYYVRFPDIEEAFTDGDSLKEAIYNAQEVLGLVIYEREKMGREIPKATESMIKTGENESLSYISVWMPLVRDRIEEKSVKKTLTIPKWLNDLAEENNINFSQLLQVAIKKYIGLN
ncbi:MAG: type II toxin-antitoxin system HicB family antitoxin [Peptoniphilus harei]|uniref:Toxin-antitoxin system, antitoxin component, HicB family n=2 Tax=Peptoniphilus harei TaxID=54005 RepID=E4KXC1_9FIRM|nr:type II toxin-antitoxin system HicB family antitoxin [Peptoniphilus harei]EFR33442.1 toxin-antitoxin system, antitoxin component, HicB family [Peptoniphilus harei ACS-146-V-Sch2b]KXA31466.1 toxin-antitoxin system, antitoxin component, HicB family [Peptoniphilus harei]MDK7355887.1 type II toxin-antitoxin system HicB family antitoxin [Peptoniphilus harei]MDK7371514.1 type II toxin-antitoxin system HicB family antitoxin [Peptoniphilus harei]MDK7377669.1 type II toxin-antitoxin system HicB fami